MDLQYETTFCFSCSGFRSGNVRFLRSRELHVLPAVRVQLRRDPLQVSADRSNLLRLQRSRLPGRRSESHPSKVSGNSFKSVKG